MVADMNMLGIANELLNGILTPEQISKTTTQHAIESRGPQTRVNLFNTTPGSKSVNCPHHRATVLEECKALQESSSRRSADSPISYEPRRPLETRTNQLKLRPSKDWKQTWRKNTAPLASRPADKENAPYMPSLGYDDESTTDGSFFRLAAQVSDLNIDGKPRPKPAARKLAFLKHSISLPDTNAPPSQLIPTIRHQESISWDATTARHHFQPSAPAPAHQPSLPVTLRHDGMAFITPATMAEVLSGQHSDKFRAVHILDARFDYEYRGGHIQGAVHIPDEAAFDQYLHAHIMPPAQGALPDCIIVHCEYSQQRGPQLYQYIRHSDRKKNIHRYPHLDHPELYVVQGGYREFFSQHQTLCEPQAYIPMDDPQYKEEFWRHSKSLKRIKSYSQARDSPRRRSCLL